MGNFYLDSVPLGKGYTVGTKQTFFARTWRQDHEIVEAAAKLQQDFLAVQDWLAFEYGQSSRLDYEGEVPAQIRSILCPEAAKDVTPSSKEDEVTSNSKSKDTSSEAASSTPTKAKRSNSTSRKAKDTDASTAEPTNDESLSE